MTDKAKKRHRLLLEILGMTGLCLGLAAVLYLLITVIGRGFIDWYFLRYGLSQEEFAYARLDRILYGAGLAVSVLFFIILFFAMFGERLAYIRKITAGIHALQDGQQDVRVELAGNNELTELAEAVNFLSESQQELKEREARLTQEREELIRTLSHDIRTPLTSLMSYTQLLSQKEGLTDGELREYLALVDKKTAQIRELTDVLLDGGRRNPEYFADARLLLRQLADEFEAALEEAYPLTVTLSPLPAFSGSFDVGELQRIFDNLISNIQKYADPAGTVSLTLSKTDAGVVICQSNAICRQRPAAESHRMGLSSIRRIAHHYGGTVEVADAHGQFTISILLPKL